MTCANCCSYTARLAEIYKLSKTVVRLNMTAGAKPGERRGGRAKGTPNKATIDRRLAVLQATGVGDYSERLGRVTLAKMVFEMEVLAEKYHPDRGDEPNEELFFKYATMAASIASDLAPYQSPKLASIHTSTSRTNVLERVGITEQEVMDEVMAEITESGQLPRAVKAYLSRPVAKDDGGKKGNGSVGVANR